MIELLLNKDVVQVDGLAPTTSVLDWLRTKKDLVGTKEGCASGDCGACTVIIGEQTSTGLVYRSVNACLMLLGNLHGKHLITVEALTDGDLSDLAALHPAQRAMVECHGSQCGFCTPGFIMSMCTLYMNEAEFPGEEKVIEQLGGNLCRCTGYRPIIEACRVMYTYPRSDDPFSNEAKTFFAQPNPNKAGLQYDGKSFYLPQTLNELVTLKAQFPEAKLVAGGTDLSLEFTQLLNHVDVIISVSQVAELLNIAMKDSMITIGAAATYADFVPVFLEHYPEAKEMFHRLGSSQIRNAGTLGGSLGNASPIGDPAPLLIALNATMTIACENGTREIPVDEFFVAYRKTLLAPNEVIAAINLPMRTDDTVLACYKISKRVEDDISAVLFAIAFNKVDGLMADVRTGFGGMAATPMRAVGLEKLLEGQPLNTDVIQNAAEHLAEEFNPMTDVRATRAYRLTVCQNLLQRFEIEQNTQTITRVSHAAL